MLSPLWETDLSPKGVDSAFMTQVPGPGSFPAPRLLTQDAFPPYAQEQGQGPSCSHKDKHILMGQNHFPLAVTHSGGAGLSLCVHLKKGKLPVCEGEKSPPNSSMALGHQSALTKQHPNGLSINESGPYGSHLP